jgi:hypothetical protein
VNRLWGWTLATLCTRRSDLYAFWAEKSPDQIGNIRMYLENAGEASVPAPWPVLTRLITGLRAWLVQGVLAALSALGLLQAVMLLAHPIMERLAQAWTQHQLHRLKKCRWISMAEGYILELRDG